MLGWPFYSLAVTAPMHWQNRIDFRWNWGKSTYGNYHFRPNLVEVSYRANCNRFGKPREVTDDFSAAIKPSVAIDENTISD